VQPSVEWNAAGDLVTGPEGTVVYDEAQGLRTVDAVSPSVRAEQVLGSLVGFGLIYVGLAAVWLFVLDRKIKHGPGPEHEPEGGGAEGLLEAAGSLAGHQDSMTGAADQGAPERR